MRSHPVLDKMSAGQKKVLAYWDTKRLMKTCVHTSSAFARTGNTHRIALCSVRGPAVRAKAAVRALSIAFPSGLRHGPSCGPADFPMPMRVAIRLTNGRATQGGCGADVCQQRTVIPEPTCNTGEFHPFDMDDSEGIRMVVGINLPRVSQKPYAFMSDCLKVFRSRSTQRQRASNAAFHVLRTGCRA